MKSHFSRFFKCSVVFALTVALQVGAASSQTFEDSSVRLSGHVPKKAVSEAVLLENLDGNASVPLTFVLPLRNKEALEH